MGIDANSTNVKIVADSTCDLSEELKEKYHISIIPLCIVMEDKSFYDGEEITPEFLTAARNLQSAGTRLHHSRCAAPAQIAVLQP